MKFVSGIRLALCVTLMALTVVGLLPQVGAQVSQASSLRGATAIEQLKQQGQYESVEAAMQQARFGVSRVEQTPLGRSGWHAPNPVAGYDAYVTEEGVSLAVNERAVVSLRLRGVGYGAALRGVSAGEVSGDKQSIAIERDGGVREWYVNGPEGLEQGFTLAEPPGVRQAGEPLRLALAVSEGWQAAAREDGQQVTLQSAGGEVVEYSKLLVRDAKGREVTARLAVEGKREVVIEVEDHEAVYPLTIDPLFTLQQKLVAADGAARDVFGKGVALEGNTLVIGAYNRNIGTSLSQGAVYVFVRSGASWTLQQTLTASDGASHDEFGISVALDGETLAVGAPKASSQGAVYIFTRSGATWSEQQKLTASDASAFGTSVALSNSSLVVGAPAGFWSGMAAYVFTRSGVVWMQQQKLTAIGSTNYIAFGGSVVISGDTVAVGAAAPYYHGEVYVFVRNNGVWTLQQKLFAYDFREFDFFGGSLSLEGNTLAVGAYGARIGNNYWQGAVYIYVRGGNYWSLQQKLNANDGAGDDIFGYAVALDGETLAVGAMGDDIGMNLDQGSAYVFVRSGATWMQQQKLTAGDGAIGDFFGGSVALDGETLAVGAYTDDVGANFNQGSVYVHTRPPCPFVTLPSHLLNGFVGIPYQHMLPISGGTGPYQVTLVGGALPPNITMSSAGLLSGTPSTAGSYSFTVRILDLSTFCTVTRTTTLIVSHCPQLLLDSPDLPSGAVGVPYSEQLVAVHGREPYTFGVKGALPPGITISVSGEVSGTPQLSGAYHFHVLIKDAAGCVSAVPMALTIDELGGGGTMKKSTTKK